MTIEKILLVDDEPDIRAIGKMSLEDLGGWKVVMASNGAEALELATREQPDLVILDVMMPEMDGPTTLARLREQPATASIPIVFMTAKVQTEETERYLALGAAGVVKKPFDPLTLPDEIRAITASSA